jgi:hypothetical protein
MYPENPWVRAEGSWSRLVAIQTGELFGNSRAKHRQADDSRAASISSCAPATKAEAEPAM